MKLRILCSDPYATDSSSSEDEEDVVRDKPSCQKQFVREVIVPSPPKPELSNSMASAYHDDRNPAWRQTTESGKSGPFIRDSVRKIQTDWEGLCGTPEEAAVARDEKKTDPDSIVRSSSLSSRYFGLKFNSKITDSNCSVKEKPSSSAHDVAVQVTEERVGSTKHQGVILTKSGKWGAHIWHPIRKKEIWLGTHFTAEEAADAYGRKKMEFESLVVVGSKKKSPSVSKSIKQESVEDKPCFSREDGISFGGTNKDEGLLMEEKKSSRRHPPFKKTKLGQCAGSMKHPTSWGRGSAHGLALPVDENRGVASRRYQGVALTKSGKWGAHIWHPVQKKELWLGTYFTAEEAADAHDRKKLEFESLAVGSKRKFASVSKATTQEPIKGKPCSNHGIKDEGQVMEGRHLHPAVKEIKKGIWGGFAKRPMRWERSSAQVLTLPVADNCVASTKHRGVVLTKSGKWRAHIWHPIRKRETYLGTYLSFEEAAKAYDKEKLEIESLVIGSKMKSASACKAQETIEDEPSFSRDVGVSIAGNKGEGHIMEEKHLNQAVQKTETGSTCEEEEEEFHRLDSSKLAGNRSSPSVKEISPPASESRPREEEGIKEDHEAPQGNDDLITSGNHRDFERQKQPFIRQTKSRSSIRDPIEKMTVWLRSYRTPEEAESVYHRKRLEFETNICARKEKHSLSPKCGDVVRGREKRVIRKRRREEFVVPSDSDDADLEEIEAIKACRRKKRELKPKVFLTNNGKPIKIDNRKPQLEVEVDTTGMNIREDSSDKGSKWVAEIQKPGSRRSKLHLGTCSTQEEPTNAKVVELQSIASCKKEATERSKAPTDLSGLAYTSPLAPASEGEQSTVVNGHESDGTGGSSTVEQLLYTTEKGFGCGIINCYGQLLGEYWKLDEELWFSKPNEDDQATATMDEWFAWELKSPVKLGSVI